MRKLSDMPFRHQSLAELDAVHLVSGSAERTMERAIDLSGLDPCPRQGELHLSAMVVTSNSFGRVDQRLDGGRVIEQVERHEMFHDKRAAAPELRRDPVAKQAVDVSVLAVRGDDPAAAASAQGLGMASNELIEAQDRMLLLGRKTAQEKVASFLLMISERATKRSQPNNPIDLPMIRADIADFLGLTTETVSRTLTQLKTAGTIRLLENSRVLLADLDALSTLAGGG